MHKYPHLAAQIFNTPLLAHPGKLDAIIAGLSERMLGTAHPLHVAPVLPPDAANAVVPAEMFSTRRGKAVEDEQGDAYVLSDGVAVIFASGALVHRSRPAANSSYFLGYNHLADRAEAAAADPNVHAILKVYDSPGGEVSGAFEYADRMYELRGKKPMWAIADDMAASAASLGGSSFERLAVTATGYLGSIGVVLRHVDVSRALANDGLKITHIFAGAHKVDGNPYEPLSKDVHADLQAEVEAVYEQFVAAVVRNRGLSAERVRSTQARTYRGASAVDIGLADRVATTDQLITELAALRARSYPVGQPARSPGSQSAATPVKGATMSQTQPATDPVASTPQGITEAQALAREQAAHTRGITEGRAQELARANGCRAVMLPGHEALVEKMVADGTSTPEQTAMAVLAAERTLTSEAAAKHRADAPKAVPTGHAPADGGKLEGVEAGRAAVASYREYTGQKGA